MAMSEDEYERLREADVQRYLQAQGQTPPVDPLLEHMKVQTDVQRHILLLLSIGAILAGLPGMIWLLVIAFFAFLMLLGAGGQ